MATPAPRPTADEQGSLSPSVLHWRLEKRETEPQTGHHRRPYSAPRLPRVGAAPAPPGRPLGSDLQRCSRVGRRPLTTTIRLWSCTDLEHSGLLAIDNQQAFDDLSKDVSEGAVTKEDGRLPLWRTVGEMVPSQLSLSSASFLLLVTLPETC